MYKFLLIDDDEEARESFKGTIERMNDQAKAKDKDSISDELYSLEMAETYQEGFERLSSDFNGIIVDLKLDEKRRGEDIIKKIIDEYRVPTVIFTGTPIEDLSIPVPVYIKGEVQQEVVIKEFEIDFNTGIFEILGGKGVIEDQLNKIFWNSLYKRRNIWKGKLNEGVNTKNILLRYTLAQIYELLEEEDPTYIKEEMYVQLFPVDEVKTGTIYQDKGVNFIVLSPPCDLAKHDGKFKTDRILMCEIEKKEDVEKGETKNIKSSKKIEKKIESLIKNKKYLYYHWLPKNDIFEGGYINFRKITTYTQEEFEKLYIRDKKDEVEFPQIKVQNNFVKNILNRFSAYYARQGQPDFDFKKEVRIISEQIKPTEQNS